MTISNDVAIPKIRAENEIGIYFKIMKHKKREGVGGYSFPARNLPCSHYFPL